MHYRQVWWCHILNEPFFLVWNEKSQCWQCPHCGGVDEHDGFGDKMHELYAEFGIGHVEIKGPIRVIQVFENGETMKVSTTWKEKE